VLDNDDGLRTVASTIKTTFNVLINKTTTDSFYRITENLYLVKTPENNGDSCIEDLFPASWKSKVLNGKKLSLKSKIDPQTEYGKEVFAKSVIKPNANKIDFSGFDPLLKRIIDVFDDYETVKVTL
jgi:RNA-directed DNA polymerase